MVNDKQRTCITDGRWTKNLHLFPLQLPPRALEATAEDTHGDVAIYVIDIKKKRPQWHTQDMSKEIRECKIRDTQDENMSGNKKADKKTHQSNKQAQLSRKTQKQNNANC